MSKTNPRQYVRIPHSLFTTDGIKASTIATYAALASYADKDGFSWPSVPSIAKRAGLSEKITRRECQRLIELGYLTKSKHFDGTGLQRSNRYILTWQREMVVEKDSTEQLKRQTPLTFPSNSGPSKSDTRTNSNKDNYNHLTTAAELVENSWDAGGKTQTKRAVIRIVATALENGVEQQKLLEALAKLSQLDIYISAYSLSSALNPKPLTKLRADEKVDWSSQSEDL